MPACRWCSELRFCALLLGALCLLLAIPARSAEPLRVGVISTDFNLPGKVRKMDAWGRVEGVSLRYLSVDQPPPGGPAAWLADSDMVILDTPAGGHAQRVRAMMAEALDAHDVPWLALGGLPDAAHGFDDADARTLAEYYRQGGEVNLRHFLRWLGRWHRGESRQDIPPPRLLPQTGYYHPDAAEPFAQLDAYFEWRRGQGLAEGARIGVLISAYAIGSLQLRDVDAVIRALEARGLEPVAFWFERDKPDGLQQAIAAARPAALLNLTHLGGRGRAQELAALDVPALIGMTARGQTREQWREAASGVGHGAVATLMAGPESWGMSDAMVLAAVEDGEPVPIAEQVEAVADKLAALAALRDTPVAQKRLALMFWNSPDGEKNLGASQMNVPRSLEQLGRALAGHGYRVDARDAEALTADAQAMLGGWYRPDSLRELLQRDVAVALPLSEYREELAGWPETQRRAMLEKWGDPATAGNVIDVGGEAVFVIPRLQLGHWLLMPQPPRAGRFGVATHDGAVPPSHAYMAAYTWLRRQFRPHALIHFGTHGTQEWLPGKDRGLWAFDWPNLAIGALAVVYPYIQDNIGEGTQAKRRGRAVLVSHQTPAFAPSGLYEQLLDLHDRVHEYQQAEEGGPVRAAARQRILELVAESHLDRDLGWEREHVEADFDGFFIQLHDHLHALASKAMPLGLHVFGQPAAPEHRLSTLMQQLGDDFYRAAGSDPQEVFAGDFRQLQQTAPYRLLHAHLREGVPLQQVADARLREMLELARQRDAEMADTQETEMLLHALDGGMVPPGEAGDPIRNPAARGGRNLYAFDAARIPTRSAHAAGIEAFEQLAAQHRAAHGGAWPRKLAFVMWSVESVRHLGIQEAQILHAAGLQPVWDAAGRVERFDIIPAAQLGRPRVDVLVQVAGSYRDQFDGFMRKLDDALQRLAVLDEAGNAIAHNSRRLRDALAARGVAAERAEAASRLRIFGNQPGDYGTGFTDRVMDSGAWDEPIPLAEQYIARMQYAYGGKDWGQAADGEGLFGEQLRSTEGVVLPRSSNVYGALNTDHVFEYMGGLSTAIRAVGGQAPELYLSDLTGARPRTVTAARYVAAELRSRYLNPQWIEAMQAEGYAGTLQVLDVTNNLFGWQASAPGVVRDDQWQALHETYVTDARGLGTREWFEAANPTAQAQIIERMAEAVRKGYWQADENTRRELAERWKTLVAAGADAARGVIRDYLEQGLPTAETRSTPPPAADTQSAVGYGLGPSLLADIARGRNTPANAPAAQATEAAPAEAAPHLLRGQVMRQIVPAPLPPVPWLARASLWLLLLALLAGAWRQWRGGWSPIVRREPDEFA